MGTIFSIIDVGTNSILLLIADKHNDTITVLHREAETSSLGKGMKNGLLTEEGIERAKIILEKYIQVSRKYMADKIIITGTSASREAKNISKLSDWLKKRYKLPYHVLSEEQELYYDYLANKHEFEEYKNLIIFDIGGGSTEFIIVEDSEITYSVSLKIGVRRLNNLFESDVDKYSFCDKILFQSAIKDYAPSSYQVVGVGGTVTNLVAVKQGLKTWISEKVHKQILTLNDMLYFKDLWKKLSNEKIEMLIPFDPHRSDVLLSGTILLESIFSYLGIKDIFVSDYGLQFGILKEAEKF